MRGAGIKEGSERENKNVTAGGIREMKEPDIGFGDTIIDEAFRLAVVSMDDEGKIDIEKIEKNFLKLRSRSHTIAPEPNLSCLGNYERDPCLIPSCPVKVKCREYTKLRQSDKP
jgi:hypothetical protein